jgi:hypothetical protein
VIAVPVHYNVNFRIERADAIAESALGATVIPPFDTLGFRNAVVADSQGAVFSISEPRV